MKLKILALVISALMLICALASCGKKDIPSGTEDGTEAQPPDTDAPAGREVTEYAGMYEERYEFIFEDICPIADTFSVDRMSDILASDDIEEKRFPAGSDISLSLPKIYRYINDLSLSREEVEAYYNTAYELLANPAVPTDEQYDALFSGDDARIMQACVHETALYRGGHVYSISMLLTGDDIGADEAEIKAVCDRALAYYGEEFTKSPLLTDEMREKLANLGFAVISDAEKDKKTLCSVHGDEYHTYPDVLVKLVGKSAFDTWKKEASKNGNDECTHGDENIYGLIHSLDISKEDFIELYNTRAEMIGDYPIDILFDGTAEDADAYYRASTAETRAEVERRKAFVELKEYIVSSKGMDDFIDNVMEFSLPEILLMADFTDADLEDYRRFCSEKEYSYDIDFGEIMARADEFVRMMNKHSVYFTDSSAIGVPAFETPYEAQSAY